MPTYLHYKLAIGRKNHLYYAHRSVSRAHEFDLAHVKYDVQMKCRIVLFEVTQKGFCIGACKIRHLNQALVIL